MNGYVYQDRYSGLICAAIYHKQAWYTAQINDQLHASRILYNCIKSKTISGIFAKDAEFNLSNHFVLAIVGA